MIPTPAATQPQGIEREEDDDDEEGQSWFQSGRQV